MQPSDATEESAGFNPGYLAFHAPRYEFLATLVAGRVRADARVLDVGRSPLTARLARRLGRPVDSLGLEPDATLASGRHRRFDLNDTQWPERWRRDLGPYDAVVLAEVIEHLHTAPELVLGYLRRLLVPGGRLFVQTPNAAALWKRRALLLGHNPFERIRADPGDPGHFREYTAGELRQILRGAGFTVERVWMKFYFDARHERHTTGREPPARLRGSLKNALYRLLPGPLREGITVLARRD
jgi:2-polyprenyl-3-methyl-5-hydroxy-6-metoxy-1,4-benzoquinol methylase